MSAHIFFALLLFAFVASITPGPNNLMVLTSGVNFGFRRTVPHMLGIIFGFVVLLLAVGFGLGALLTLYPPLHLALKIAGGAYLLYLAWRIALSRSMSTGEGTGGEPMTFWQAAAFQWVNPKAWVMGVTAMALYTNPEAPLLTVLVVTAAFGIVSVPSLSSWTAFGTALRGLLSNPVRLKWFNIVMGLLLVASLWPMLR